MTAVGGPLVIAACTEFTSLILLRFVEERRRGLEPQRGGRRGGVAHRARVHRVGAHRHRRRRGARRSRRCRCCATSAAIVALNVAVALLSALVVLPPMLVWADKRNWVSRGMLGKQPEPFIPTPPMGEGTAAAAGAPSET